MMVLDWAVGATEETLILICILGNESNLGCFIPNSNTPYLKIYILIKQMFRKYFQSFGPRTQKLLYKKDTGVKLT